MSTEFIERGCVQEGETESGGYQRIYRFPNNWGASVVSGPYAYGYKKGLHELAVIKWEEDDWSLNYEHEESNGDVRGYLTIEEVNEILAKIEATK